VAERPSSPAPPTAELGVFGGSGFYAFLEDVEHVTVNTPYGSPSAPVALGELEGRRVAFLPRHGADHRHAAHRINYRANVWAMYELGVRRIFAPCAAGSLQRHVAPGHLVVCDQLVDRTWGRDDTYSDEEVYHLPFADPYCPQLRTVAVEAARTLGFQVHDGGTVVVVQGPRFSTRAESRWYRSQGWEVINMTQHPEAALARELGLCYATIALITDYDSGLDDDPEIEPVSQEAVFRFFEENVDRLRELLRVALPAAVVSSCGCAGTAAPIAGGSG
jgi:5'-methylthioadenosine phosphorylase